MSGSATNVVAWDIGSLSSEYGIVDAWENANDVAEGEEPAWYH